MRKVDVVAETGPSKFGSDPSPTRSARRRDVDVVTFLQTALADGAVDVSELEKTARAAGLHLRSSGELCTALNPEG